MMLLAEAVEGGKHRFFNQSEAVQNQSNQSLTQIRKMFIATNEPAEEQLIEYHERLQ